MDKGKFDWIYSVDPSRWSEYNGKRHIEMELAGFLRLAGLDSKANWQAEFKEWSSRQSLEYQAMPMKEPRTGETLAVTIVQLNVVGAM